MRVIREGHNDVEYVFDCEICGCVFALSTKEFACSDSWGVRCPCCDNLIGKNLAFKDLKGRYKNDGETVNDKRKHSKETLKTEIRGETVEVIRGADDTRKIGDPIVKKFT